MMNFDQIHPLLGWGILSIVMLAGLAVFFIKNQLKRHSCPECGSTKVRLVEQRLERIAKHLGEATYGGYKDVHIPIMKNHYQCNVCHHKWDELSAD